MQVTKDLQLCFPPPLYRNKRGTPIRLVPAEKNRYQLIMTMHIYLFIQISASIPSILNILCYIIYFPICLQIQKHTHSTPSLAFFLPLIFLTGLGNEKMRNRHFNLYSPSSDATEIDLAFRPY